MTLNATRPVPVAFPYKTNSADGTTVLAADIGGTKTNLALFKKGGPELVKIRSAVYRSADYHSFGDMVRQFSGPSDRPQRISIAIAGPVVNHKASATNLGWGIDLAALKTELEMSDIFLLNDLEANAYGLAALRPDEFWTLNTGNPEQPGNAAIISPGTGLGEAGLFWDGQAYHPFATEGGHADFSPRSPLDVEFLQYLQGQYDHVSWERVVSGMGIYHIFQFLRDVKGHSVPDDLAKKIAVGDPAKVIGEGAQKDCFICVNTINLFFKYLAVESSNMALKFKATGGIYIGGGIVPKLLDLLKNSDFFTHFKRAGRLQALMESISVKVVLNPEAALLGAGWYGVGY